MPLDSRPILGHDSGRRSTGQSSQSASGVGMAAGEEDHLNRRDLLALLGAASLPSLARAQVPAQVPAQAQAPYPQRPIKLMVPFSAGGVTDIVGRQWAERMKGPLGSI